MPLVTVIVPAYNEEKHLEECLTSVKSQTYKKIELIIVDDGSTDKTHSIAKKYANTLLVQKHQGPGVARNKAAKIAKGKILVFVDADMYLDKTYIENIIKPISLKKAKATYTTDEYVANARNIWVRCGNIDNNIPQGKRMKNFKAQPFVARAITKEYFFKLGGVNPQLGYRDDHMFLGIKERLLVKASRAICYHYNPDSLYEIFESAKWIGKNPYISKNKFNLLRYSIVNSFLISVKKVRNGAPWPFFVYKVIFDFGIFCGIIFSNSKNNYAK